ISAPFMGTFSRSPGAPQPYSHRLPAEEQTSGILPTTPDLERITKDCARRRCSKLQHQWLSTLKCVPPVLLSIAARKLHYERPTHWGLRCMGLRTAVSVPPPHADWKDWIALLSPSAMSNTV